MPRLPHAAKTLIAEAEAKWKTAKAEPHGEPDGLRVIRTVRFNKAVADKLAHLLDLLEDDRIAWVGKPKGGGLDVTFVPGIRADSREPFYLAIAEQISEMERDIASG